MKRSLLLYAMLFALLFLLFGGVEAGAESPNTDRYTVSSESGKYRLTGPSGGESETIGELLSSVPDGSTVELDGVAANSQIVINKSVRLTGELSSRYDIIIGDGAKVTLSSVTLTLFGDANLIIRGGELISERSLISGSRGALRLEGRSRGSFLMSGGRIYSEGNIPPLVIEKGSAVIETGSVENPLGRAIDNYGTLTLGRGALFSSSGTDIYTEEPIYLSYLSESFRGCVSIAYGRTFDEGTLTPVVLGADLGHVEKVKITDINGLAEQIEYFDSYFGFDEVNFIGVYKPYTVRYYANGTEYAVERRLKGESPSGLGLPERTGYVPKFWATDELGTSECAKDLKITSDLALFASYSLAPPNFTLFSLTTVFDEARHTLTFDTLWHPLEDEGFYSFCWINEDGITVSESRGLEYSSVGDSGRYKCRISFFVGRDSVTVETPYIELKIDKKTVPIPELPAVYYNGEVQYPNIEESPYYTYLAEGFVDAGRYPVSLTLVSGENYQFEGRGGMTANAVFEIKRAENIWTVYPSVRDEYFGSPVSFVGGAKFGEVRFFFSASPEGEFSEEIPTAIGRYYLFARVVETENYLGLESEPIEFSIIDDAPVSIGVKSPPLKTEYTAFERFDLSGLTLSLKLSSGKERELSAREVSIYYQTDPFSLRFGDTAVIVEYAGLRTSVPVRVNKKSYQLDKIEPSVTYTFDGSYKSYPEIIDLPVGIDGIALEYTAIGGGTSVGVYDIVIRFHTESEDYEAPEDLTVSLTVEPLSRRVEWSGVDFVYDGTLKCPSAYFTDVFGARIPLAVSGGGVTAGDGYIAIAESSDKNYRLTDTRAVFNIAKADYNTDGVFWSDSSFVYCADVRTVCLMGLPEGVVAVGYTNNSFTDAGVYYADVTLSYDSVNYNPPDVKGHVWEITRADYDLSGFLFSGEEYIYDGMPHYPTVSGDMPIGLDGKVLSYRFSAGVRCVGDTPYVVVEFLTESKNYNTPDSIILEVRIKPRPIEVIWSDTSLVYNGKEQFPKAYSPECAILTEGVGVFAGEYTAIAVAEDENYTVKNPTVCFVIDRAENYWLKLPSIKDIYSGESPCPEATPAGGEVVFIYYSDAELTTEVIPDTTGVYYMVAYSDGGENYKELFSEPVKFTVAEVSPISFIAVPSGREYRAFDKIDLLEISFSCVNNDGTVFTPDIGEIRVIYGEGGSLLAGTCRVTFEYRGLLAYIDFEVKRAVYDTSAVRWQNTEHYYNGKTKEPTLLGLPLGVSVVEILGDESSLAGEYPLSCILEYDSENYEPPVIPEGILRIKKQPVTVESLKDAVYNGKEQTPKITSDLYYAESRVAYVDSGEYKIPLTLYDSDNYVFEGEAYATFKIVPRRVAVRLRDISVRLFDVPSADGYTVISGEIIDGDELLLRYSYDGTVLSAVSDNPNYSVEVKEGVIRYLPMPSRDVMRTLLVCLMVGILVALLFLIALRYRERSARIIVRTGESEDEVRRVRQGRLRTVVIPRLSECSVTSVDRDKADELLTNGIARTLIRRSGENITTDGIKRGVVNIDTLSLNFEAGERVDINVLKAKGLLARDVGYYKVLARGVLDKPLIIYANDFSISAVKMIALTGGEIYKLSGKPFKIKF